MKKLLGTVAGLALALALPISAAWAQYPPGNSIEINDATAVRGQSLTAIACCFDGTVNWTAQSTPRSVGTSTADSNGTATITFVVPSDFENGTHTLFASGFDLNGFPQTLSTTFTVSSSGGGLTPTGTNSIPWLLIGVGAVTVGGTFVGVSKRRAGKA